MSDPSDEWAGPATSWDDEPAVIAYADAAHRSLVESGVELADARVLDFGCGTGLLTERLLHTVGPVDAVDTSEAMLSVLRRKADERGWSTVRASSDLADAHGPYDLVVCSSVCGFLDDYPGAVRHLASLLAPGGAFVQWDWEREPDDTDGHGLTRREITAALDGAGLAGVEVRTAFTVVVEGESMAPLLGSAVSRPDVRVGRPGRCERRRRGAAVDVPGGAVPPLR